MLRIDDINIFNKVKAHHTSTGFSFLQGQGMTSASAECEPRPSLNHTTICRAASHNLFVTANAYQNIPGEVNKHLSMHMCVIGIHILSLSLLSRGDVLPSFHLSLSRIS